MWMFVGTDDRTVNSTHLLDQTNNSNCCTAIVPSVLHKMSHKVKALLLLLSTNLTTIPVYITKQ